MNPLDALAVAEYRLEAIRKAIHELLDSSGGGDPGPWAMFTLGQIVATLDLTDEEVERRIQDGV